MSDHEQPFSLSCAEAQESLSAMLDGELDIASEKAVRQHVERCPDCILFERDLHALHARLAALPDRPGDGAAAWERAKAQIADSEEPQAPIRKPRQGFSPTRWAVAAMVVLGITIGGWQMFGNPSEDREIIAEPARDFQVFQAGGKVLDIAATHPDAVHNWMAARVDFMLPGRLHSPEGIRIAGARLCSLLGRKLAFIAYSVDGKDIGLYVARAGGMGLAKDGSMQIIRTDDGLTTIGWRSGNLAYVLVSELPSAKLRAFGTHVQQASNMQQS